MTTRFLEIFSRIWQYGFKDICVGAPIKRAATRELRKELRALGLHIKQKTVWNEEIYLENFALFGRIDHSAGKDHVISGSDEE